MTSADPGHTSNTFLAPLCLACIGGCDVAWSDCTYHFAALSLACGPFAVLCVVGSVAGCAAVGVGCAHLCKTNKDVCCPVGCKSTLLAEACCDSGELCLNSDRGLCCNAGSKKCSGSSCCAATDACCGPNCCAADQTCIDAANGKCCDTVRNCGSVCCPGQDTCQNAASAQCCLPDKACGTACCGHDPATLPPGTIQIESFCVDASKNLCCSADEVECNGACCGGPNKECVNNACVFKSTVTCDAFHLLCVGPNGELDDALCKSHGFAQCGPQGCCQSIVK